MIRQFMVASILSLFARTSAQFGPIVNRRVFIPCIEQVCYEEYDIGCFEPWDLLGYFSLPFISVCPESPKDMDIQFYVLSSEFPSKIQSESIIQCGKSVAFVIHGYLTNSMESVYLLPAVALLKYHDYVVLVDWRRPANPSVIAGFPIPIANFYVMQADIQVVGRIVANFIAKRLVQGGCIDPKKIKIVGFSAGGNMLYFISTWLKEKYNIVLFHLVGLDPSGLPYYFSRNFKAKQIGPGLADFVDMVQCTYNPRVRGLTELAGIAFRFGSQEASGDTKYLVNLPFSYLAQPGCETTPACSHLYCLLTYAASLMGCEYQYTLCSYTGPFTYGPEVTKIDSPTEGRKGVICIKVPESPLQECLNRYSSNSSMNFVP